MLKGDALATAPAAVPLPLFLSRVLGFPFPDPLLLLLPLLLCLDLVLPLLVLRSLRRVEVSLLGLRPSLDPERLRVFDWSRPRGAPFFFASAISAAE